jgi:hypothetical protein
MNFRFRAFSTKCWMFGFRNRGSQMLNVKTRPHSARNLQILVIIIICLLAIAKAVADYAGKSGAPTRQFQTTATSPVLSANLHNDRCFEHACIAVRGKKGHDFLERNLAIDQQRAWHRSTAEKLDRLSHIYRPMVKNAEKGDLVVMNAMGVELDFASGRATTKETYFPTLPHHANAQGPGLRFTNRLNHTIRAAIARSSTAYGLGCI